MPTTEKLRAEARAADTQKKRLRYAERAMIMLADHHAILDSSFDDTYGLSSMSDMWVEWLDERYVVTSVRGGFPAAAAGVEPGAHLAAVDGVAIDRAVADFWQDLGVAEKTDPERNAYAARVLTIGRMDRGRDLTIVSPDGARRRLALENLDRIAQPDRPPVELVKEGNGNRIVFNDSLDDTKTVAAFDTIMASLENDAPVTLDLRETVSGGNTVIAKAVMAWFIVTERPYQVHVQPAEERKFGIARKWIELVLPRAGKHHSGPVDVLVGRWTGSMGEGLAIGMDALGFPVCGTRMAGLRGAVYTLDLEGSAFKVNLPAERLYTVDGTPREDFVPPPCA